MTDIFHSFRVQISPQEIKLSEIKGQIAGMEVIFSVCTPVFFLHMQPRSEGCEIAWPRASLWRRPSRSRGSRDQ